MDPVQKAAYDVKYTLFNNNLSNASSIHGEYNDYEDKSSSKAFHTKLLTEITSIFHMMLDLRQHYLMSNNVEFFYESIYLKYKDVDKRKFTPEEYSEINKILVSEFTHLIPDIRNFHSHMSYELPSIDKMYDADELVLVNAAEMHDEFVGLMVDTFNLHSHNPFLRQLIILLISRYHSERAEFIRNLDRTLLFFDYSDWTFYTWVQRQLGKFVSNSEKSHIWLMQISKVLNNLDSDIDNSVPVNHELEDLNLTLKELKRAVVYNCKITTDKNGELEAIFELGNRKINVYAQNLYRNVKLYDYLINFLFQNIELLIKVRKIDMKKLEGNQLLTIKMVRKIFKKIFRVLEVMTANNPKTQELMWKYKEDFVINKLGSTEQEGELELVLVIIDDSENAIKHHQNKWTLSKTREFVNSLNKRVKGKENLVLILEIYNKLIKFEAISFLKQSLTKLVVKNPEDLHTFDKTSRREFEKSLNLQEIIYSIIYNQEMVFIRNYLKEIFKFGDLFEEIEKSIDQLDEIEKEDHSYDAQDYDELREFQYLDIINLYIQLYLNIEHSDTEKHALNEIRQMSRWYIKQLNKLNIEADFDNSNTFKKSNIKFLMIYCRSFFKQYKRYYYHTQEKALSMRSKKPTAFDESSSITSLISTSDIKKNMEEVDNITGEVLMRMENSDNDDIEDVINMIHDDNDEKYSKSRSNNRSREVRSLQTIKSLRVSKSKTESELTNLRSQESYNFSVVWRKYVDSVKNSRDSRTLIDKEHMELADLMFKTLTSKYSNSLSIQSYKTFISTSIDYVYSCEKKNWTLYIIIFIFKINSMVLKRCYKSITQGASIGMQKRIDDNILSSIDTLRTSSMIFKILSSSKNDSFCYSNEIFSITAYF